MGYKRIIPCLDVNKDRVVKGKKFKNIKDVADPVDLCKNYLDEGADELVLYDIAASIENRNIFLHTVERVAKNLDIPFTVGGGVRTVDDFRRVLDAGADKVSINSAAVINPYLIKEASQKFGSKRVVLSIDAKKDGYSWKVYIRGATEDKGIDVIEWAKEAEKLGAGEICINSIDSDGVKEGYDIPLIKKLSEVLSIPIIASGGAGKLIHFKEVLECGANAALAASVFHYKEIRIPHLKDFLLENNINIRK